MSAYEPDPDHEAQLSQPRQPRPARYRRAGPWLQELRRLHRRGLSARDIALRLGPGWTIEQVKYRLRQEGLPSNGRVHLETGTLRETSLLAERIYAAHKGWGHLVAPAEGEGVRLRRLEVDVLTALGDLGALTRGKLLDVLTRRSLRCANGVDALLELLRKGLVIRQGRVISRRRPLQLYALAEGIHRHQALKRPDSVGKFRAFLQAFEIPEV